MEKEHFYVKPDNCEFTIDIQVHGGDADEKLYILRNIYFDMSKYDFVGLPIDQNLSSFNRRIYGLRKINGNIGINWPNLPVW